MCQKIKKIWQCSHSDIEDPRKCRIASNKNRACQEYGFVWAFRDPIVEKWEGECRNCRRARQERQKREANKDWVEKSKAYPHLRDVSAHDDETRQKVGRPRYDRSYSTSEITIPDGWTPAQNRLPSNANEYEQFVRGRFNPLQQLPDNHVPPQLPGPILYDGPRPLPPPGTTHSQAAFQPQPHAFTNQARNPPQGYRSRAPPPGFAPQIPHDAEIARIVIARHERALITPPQHELGPVILEDTDYPYVEFRDLGASPPRQIHGRRSCYPRRDDGKGWVPQSTSPLPPKQQVDPAFPSGSPPLARPTSQSFP